MHAVMSRPETIISCILSAADPNLAASPINYADNNA